jgi:hypothetical protein
MNHRTQNYGEFCFVSSVVAALAVGRKKINFCFSGSENTVQNVFFMWLLSLEM